jgi:ribosomal protein S13
MSNVSIILLDHAKALTQTEESVAVALLKQAGLTEEDAKFEVAQALMEKEATSALTMKGVDYDEAVKLVKAANIDVRTLSDFQVEDEVPALASVLEKAASYISELEAYVAVLEAEKVSLETDLEKAASEYVAVTEASAKQTLPDGLSKLASVGAFTNEDLAELTAMSPHVLSKVAAAVEEPWSMGKAAGQNRMESVDPFTAFLMS